MAFFRYLLILSLAYLITNCSHKATSPENDKLKTEEVVFSDTTSDTTKPLLLYSIVNQYGDTAYYFYTNSIYPYKVCLHDRDYGETYVYNWFFKYNSKDSVTNLTQLDPDSQLIRYFKYQYNTDGSRGHFAEFDSDHSLVLYATYQYEDGNLVKESEYGADSSLHGYVEYFYENSRVTMEKVYSNKEELLRTGIYEYDSQGLLITIINSCAGTQSYCGEYTYDYENGLLVYADDDHGYRRYNYKYFNILSKSLHKKNNHLHRLNNACFDYSLIFKYQ